MGQVLSYIWKCIRPKPRNETKTTSQDVQLNHLINPFQQQNHYITIPASDIDNVSSSIPENVTSTVTDDNDLSTRVPFQQPNHYITIPASDTDNVSSSIIPEDVTSAGTDDNDLSTEVFLNKEIIAESVSNESKDSSIKKIGQYASNQKILLVGEGDFSFSACLAKAFVSAANIFATSLNSHDFLIENYGMFLTNKKELESRGSTIIYGINAKTMFKDPILGTSKFDRIIFNFPHAGKFGQTDANLQKHKDLIRGFFRNAKKMINEDGEIHITHKSNGFYLEWDIPKIGSDHGLRLIQEIKFKRSKYPGYNTKYGFGGDKDFDCNPCKTYKFGRNRYWSKLAEVRKCMRSIGLLKPPGCAWVDIGGGVEPFLVGDASSQVSHEIYSVLDGLAEQMKDIGVVFDDAIACEEFGEYELIRSVA